MDDAATTRGTKLLMQQVVESVSDPTVTFFDEPFDDTEQYPAFVVATIDDYLNRLSGAVVDQRREVTTYLLQKFSKHTSKAAAEDTIDQAYLALKEAFEIVNYEGRSYSFIPVRTSTGEYSIGTHSVKAKQIIWQTEDIL